MADVVLVEEDAVLQAMLIDILGELGHRVLGVRNAEAVTGNLLRETRASMLITDLVLPGAWGDRLCSTLNTVREAFGLKILLISDVDPSDLERRALACGADGFSTKHLLLSNPRLALAGLLPDEDLPQPPPTTPEEAVKVAVIQHLAEHQPRKNARIHCEVPVQGHSPEFGQIDGVLRNLSLEGAKLFTAASLRMDDELQMSFRLGSQPLTVRARVVWTAPAFGGTLPSLGLEFIDLDPVSRTKLDLYMRELCPELFR